MPKAATLPADQPWLLVDDEQSYCGPGVVASALIAVDRAGALTQLDRGVTAMADRPGAPPLLATCGADGTSTIVDPVGWTSTPLAMDPGIQVYNFVLSPDGQQALLQLTCYSSTSCEASRYLAPRVIDLLTGAIRPLTHFPVPIWEPIGPTTNNLSLSMEGWGAAGLYYELVGKGGWTQLNVIDPADPQATPRELLTYTRYVLDSANDLLIAFQGQTIDNISLVLSDLRRGTTQTIAEGEQITSLSFTPDGAALFYTRIAKDSSNIPTPFGLPDDPSIVYLQPVREEVVIYDIARSTNTILKNTYSDLSALQGPDGGAVTWSRDGERMTVIASMEVLTFTATKITRSVYWQATLLARDGTPINTVQLSAPIKKVFGLTHDDQLMISEDDTKGVSWLPLRPGVAPYASDIRLTEGQIRSIILPVEGSAVP